MNELGAKFRKRGSTVAPLQKIRLRRDALEKEARRVEVDMLKKHRVYEKRPRVECSQSAGKNKLESSGSTRTKE